VDEQAQAPQRAFPFEPTDEIIREADALERRAQHELAGMQDERFITDDLDQLGELRLIGPGVDHRGAIVSEHPKPVPHVQVDARRLDRVGQVRIDDDPAGVDLAPDVAVGQDHAALILPMPPQSVRPRMRRSTSRWSVSMSSYA
jgi:hypothetical protein